MPIFMVKQENMLDLKLPSEVVENYRSPAQRIRVMTEYWVLNSAFCPNCGTNLSHFENNKPVADFYCTSCKEEYELKSKNGNIGKKIVDGAYSVIIDRLESKKSEFLLSFL
jgi:type II restriction enzyme